MIGRGGRGITRARAQDHVAGYCVGQDISDRALQFADKPPQFSLGKSADSFGPIGPAVVSLDAFADPDDLPLWCEIDGQSAPGRRTSNMIFPVAELVAYLSRFCTLEPGDLIFTGTPAGVGSARDPRRYLEPGEVIRTAIEGVGELENRCVGGRMTRDRPRSTAGSTSRSASPTTGPSSWSGSPATTSSARRRCSSPRRSPSCCAQMDDGRRRAGDHHDRRRTTPEPFDEIVPAFPGKLHALGDGRPDGGHGDAPPDRARWPRRTASGWCASSPFMVNRPPNDKAYYPIYAKCIELGLPVSVNTGIPGPPMPAEPQRPLYLDEVCLFFPELDARHGARRRPVVGRGDPAAAQVPEPLHDDVGVRAEVSPAELIQFMNTRGQQKMLFASDHPCCPSSAALPRRRRCRCARACSRSVPA